MDCATKARPCGFPSPIGELHFSISSSPCRCASFLLVSVPYRGATFLNENKAHEQRNTGSFPSPIGELHFSIIILYSCISIPCFRPLSGSYISQSEKGNRDGNSHLFPSPIGELHFSIKNRKTSSKYSDGFRPLSGSYISQLITNTSAPSSQLMKVSVPYRGATFLNRVLIPYEKGTECFRPLSGSYISQLFYELLLSSCKSVFPSPIGELHFSMCDSCIDILSI